MQEADSLCKNKNNSIRPPHKKNTAFYDLFLKVIFLDNYIFKNGQLYRKHNSSTKIKRLKDEPLNPPNATCCTMQEVLIN